MNIVRMAQVLKEAKDLHGVYDDFPWYISPHLWTAVLTDAGSIAAAGVGGIATLTNSDGSVADNDEAYLATTNALFKPAANKPLYAEALIQFTEANTAAANVAFGLASSPAADLIVDNGGGMRASGAVIAIYKVDGENVWRFVTRNGTDVTVSQSVEAAGGASYQQLGIEILDAFGNYATCVPTIDGRLMISAATGQPIRHQLLLTAIANVNLFVGGKNGSTSLETTLVDYIGCWQAR
ncbi:hypothetical protein GobsT_71410 [Gemmata obscuriglobus]|uniref:Uncharacterized protein n=1 Tax=Gemmata obscuriglobus TaxID=114 RepID=A0A2Z3HDF1_9BACT|nr:hypothetical protein [Gemmata obscuriglobus]AWM41756.1 hypothetical protein C1280_35350 [Gemmata obscuriglobus]QEG32288.1 hypothetical protein GobsT_71410 [Gemmata obscuriglobus]VTS11644.1 Uncharacterized protein OS=Planctomyces brasiliensis (strain ATCC 49424 / DSM 5305 / JCM 21570 / NBRC 103401 / IFAM 1448) GN=Plabr_0222 PE=4 SV=1 [Gemmata obscuriglobus UQM 2246]